jgi:ankyrin repeat protein
LLIDNKDPNTLVQPDSKGRSVLHWLASYGCHTLSGLWTEDKLFNVEPAIMTTEKMFDAANHSPLHIAAEKNDPDAITAMLLRFPSSKSLLDKRNRSPIHIAALYGSVEALTALLEGGWDVNALDNKLRTPLIDVRPFGFPLLTGWLLIIIVGIEKGQVWSCSRTHQIWCKC